MSNPSDFQMELADLINRHSQENGSNTPDFLLAEYLTACLHAFNDAVTARERWYGRALVPIETATSTSVHPAAVEVPK